MTSSWRWPARGPRTRHQFLSLSPRPPRASDQVDAECDRYHPDEVGPCNALAQKEPPEHHPERRHQKVIGTRCRCPTDRQKVEPEQVTAHRNEKHRVGERAEQAPTRHDLSHRLESEGERSKREPASQVLDAVANP